MILYEGTLYLVWHTLKEYSVDVKDHLKTVQTGLKPSDPLQSHPDGFKTIRGAKCGFNVVGLAGFVACGPSPAPQLIFTVHGCARAYCSRDV